MTEAGCCRLWALCYRNAGEQKAVRLPLWGRVCAVLESHGQQLHFKHTFLGQKIEVVTFFRLNCRFFQKWWLMMIGYLIVKHLFIKKSPKIHLVHLQTIFQRKTSISCGTFLRFCQARRYMDEMEMSQKHSECLGSFPLLQYCFIRSFIICYNGFYLTLKFTI